MEAEPSDVLGRSLVARADTGGSARGKVVSTNDAVGFSPHCVSRRLLVGPHSFSHQRFSSVASALTAARAGGRRRGADRLPSPGVGFGKHLREPAGIQHPSLLSPRGGGWARILHKRIDECITLIGGCQPRRGDTYKIPENKDTDIIGVFVFHPTLPASGCWL